jgi:predicted Zn-dependent peptidase
VQAMDLALETLEQLHRDGISEEQLHSAKDYYKGQYPPRIETTGQLAALMADLEFYGLDDREVNELFQRIDAFTTADAKRIIEQYFPKENLVFALIGKTAEIGEAVKKYAPKIEQREIEAPGFK